jgi:peptidoglycan/LPS O-acetylase OafA/YrhL
MPGKQHCLRRKSPGFRPEVEGLRAAAVLLVVLYHFHFPRVSGGYIGVDVFFVISGYLITGLLVNEKQSTGRISYVQFYARRGRRLLPAIVIVVLMVVGASFFVYSPMEQRSIAKTALTATLYCSNLRFLRRGIDYFGAAAADDPLLHTWSLAVEEQFYLLWPLLVSLLMRKSSPERNQKRLFVGMGIVAVLSFAGSFWLTRIAQPWAFYAAPVRAWEFALGGLVWLWRERLQLVSRGLSLVGLITICVCGVLFTPRTQFPGAAVLVPALGTATVLLASPRQADFGTKFLRHPVMQYVGRLSYSWYLWHWPVLVLAAVAFPTGAASYAFCLLASLILATITHTAIENPVRFHPFLVCRPRLSLILAVSLTVVGAGLCVGFSAIGLHFQQSPQQLRFTQAAADTPELTRNGCLLSFTAREVPQCIFGDIRSNTSVVLFGDSHAAQWFPALERIALDKHWKLIVFTKSACPVPSTRIFWQALHRDYPECDQWRTETIRRILALHPSLVVASSYSTAYVQRHGVKPEDWAEGLRVTMAQFGLAEIRTVMIADPPPPSFNPVTCLSRAAWIGSAIPCTYEPDRSASADLALREKETLKDVPNVTVLDLSSAICSASKCAPVRDGTLIYRDGSHLTATYSASLAPVLEPYLEQADEAGNKHNSEMNAAMPTVGKVP